MKPAEIVETALAAASPGYGTVVIVTAQTAANVRWANNTATTNGLTDGLTWSVVSLFDGAAGSTAGSVADATDRTSIAAVVTRAQALARAAAAAGPAEDAMDLVGPDEAGGSDDGFDGEPAESGFEVFDRLISGLAESIESARSADTVLFGFARHELATVYLGTSTGVRRRWVQPTGAVEINAKSADLRRSIWAGAGTTDFADVDIIALVAGLRQRLDWSARRVEVPPGRYDTVLPAGAVGDFMIGLLWSCAARPAHEGRSGFSAANGATRIGERLTELPLSLYSDPTAVGLASAPFVVTTGSGDLESVFDNGARIGRTTLIDGGVIAALGQTRGSAAAFGEPFTPIADNLVLAGGPDGRTEADLIAGLDRGLLVTSQWYIREVDPMTMLATGLTRDGVFLVEKGEVVGATNNFRWNMSPLDVLRQAEEVGSTVRTLSREESDWFTRTAMPPLRVAGFNMSSISPAT